MKKFMLLMMVFSFAVLISAQQKENYKVPANVIKAFHVSHPTAQNVSWDKEGLNYEANYKEDSKNYSVLIDNVGKILETEREIEVSELPSGVVKYLNDNYKGCTLSGASKIVDDSGNIKYEAELKKDGKSEDVVFGEDGKPLPSGD